MIERVKHFVKQTEKGTVFLVYIATDKEEIKASFNESGEHIFVDSYIWDEVMREL